MIHKRILGFGSFLVKMLLLNCLCVLSILGVVSALIPEFILQSGASGYCGQTVSVNQSVILKSHTGAGLLGGLASYTASQNCEINYDAGTGDQVLFQFTFFDLQPQVLSSCVDYVRLTGVSTVATTSVSTATTATTTLPTTSTALATTTNATLENTTLVNTTESDNTTASNVTSANETSTMSSTFSSSISSTFSTSVTPNYTEPSGVNATFWNTTEVCNYTTVNQTVNGTSADVNETLCWNMTESYVVWIPDTSSSSTVTSPPPAGLVDVCQSPGTYVSTGSSGTVRFVSDGSIQRGGFTLLLTSFHTGSCTASEFLCDTNRCISNSLLCDGATHCVDGADESTQQANCTTSSALTATGNQYVIIGIVVVAAAVVVTIIIVIIFWKFFNKPGGKCKCRGEDESDDSPWDTPPRQQPTMSSKPTKTVKIVSEKQSAPPPRGPGKKITPITPVLSDDVGW